MAPTRELVMRQCGCRAWDLGLAEWPLRLAKRQVGVCAHSRSTATSAPSLPSASGRREGSCEACRRLRTQRGSLGPGGARQAPWRRGRQAGSSGTSRSWPRGAASGCHVHIHVRASGWWLIGPGAPNWRAPSGYIESHRIMLHSARRLRRPARGSRNSKGCLLESLRDEKASAVNFCHCYSRRGALRRACGIRSGRPPAPAATP